MHEVLVNRLGGLSLPRKSVVRLTDRPDMTLVVYRGRKTTIQLRKKCKPRAGSTLFAILSASFRRITALKSQTVNFLGQLRLFLLVSYLFLYNTSCIRIFH